MTGDAARRPRRVTIVGGGLAGLAAAVALAEGGGVELFESRQRLGGRATSFRDPESGELLDHCQHVSMGCCTNLADFCRRAGLDSAFRRDPTLNVVTPAGKEFRLTASAWLPAPLHLLPALARLDYLSRAERRAISHAMRRLVGAEGRGAVDQTMAEWLARWEQPPAAIAGFWSVVLTSALGETLDRVTVAAARKVFRSGFLANTRAHELVLPSEPLDVLYGAKLLEWLRAAGVAVHLGADVREIHGDANAVHEILLADGRTIPVDHLIVATTWRRIGSLFPPGALRAALPWMEELDRVEGSPITAVHLWFDRALTALPHAVIVGCLSQWMFRRPQADAGSGVHYYQVVISASRALESRPKDEVISRVVAELRRCFPAARDAAMLRAKVVTERHAVFSASPGTEALRPRQETSISNLSVAGDWTATAWPATMESAVRSGYAAAEHVWRRRGAARRLVAPELPESLGTRLLFGRGDNER